MIRLAPPGKTPSWPLSLLARKQRLLAAVAWANKTARTVWAIMTSGEAFRQPKAVAA